MTMFGGGSGSDFNYTPMPTPLTPMRRDKENQRRALVHYIASKDSTYIRASKGGGAPAPAKSYTASLFNATGGGGI